MNNYEIDGNPHEEHPDRKLIDALHVFLEVTAVVFGLIVVGIVSTYIKNLPATGSEKVELSEYIEVKFSGCEGAGKARLVFDQERFLADYSDKLKLSKVGYDLVGADMDGVSPAEYFVKGIQDIVYLGAWHNGDEISVELDVCTSDAYERSYYNYILEDKSFEVTVSGLDDTPTFDPFEHVNVSFSGLKGSGRPETSFKKSCPFADQVEIVVKPSCDLSEGDIVTVYLAKDPHCTDEEVYGAIPATTEKEYVVSGLQDYYRSYDEIPKTDLEEMVNRGKELVVDTIECRMDIDMDVVDVSYMGSVFLAEKDVDDLPYLNNYLACIFKVTVDVKQNDIGEVTYYTYQSFLNLYNSKIDYPNADIFLVDEIRAGYEIKRGSTIVTEFGFRSIDELCEVLMKENSSRFINIGVKENRIESDVLDNTLDESDATLQLEHPDMESAYEHIINFIEETEKANAGEIKYDLVYVTDDDIPELLVDCSGYWLSLYTYVDNKVYPIMEHESYGAWGRMYECRDREGIIHSSCYSLEGDTEITYDELYKINENYELEALYTNFDSLSYIWYSENESKYYFDANEISKEQYDEYLGSNYEILDGVYSAEEMKQHL